MTEPLTLYTIGHSDHSVEDFIALLQKYNVQVLVDVRSAPASKFVPHFNKQPLENSLKQNAISYHFAGNYLGGRPAQADVYKSNHLPDKDTKRQDFLELVQYEEIMKRDWYQKGINRLLDIIRENKDKNGVVAIMCSEGNPHDCHRHHLIARSLIDPQVKVVDTDVQVYHILKTGALENVDVEAFQETLMQPRLF
jgi:uncharacterized protein (DUF488 family)